MSVCTDGFCEEETTLPPPPAPDAGPAVDDAGALDAGPPVDAGPTDGGVRDGGVVDGGVDAGPSDGGVDAGQPVLPPPWWDDAFQQRQRLQVFAHSISGDLSGFPLRVHVDDTRIDVDAVMPEAVDVRFVIAHDDDVVDGGVTFEELEHEVERWVPGEGGDFWVRIPRLLGNGTSTVVWLYYDNPNDLPSVSNPQAVWGDRHLLVLHGDIEPLADGGVSAVDVTGNHPHVPVVGVATVDDGLAGRGMAFSESRNSVLRVPGLDGANFPQEEGAVRLYTNAVRSEQGPGAYAFGDGTQFGDADAGPQFAIRGTGTTSFSYQGHHPPLEDGGVFVDALDYVSSSGLKSDWNGPSITWHIDDDTVSHYRVFAADDSLASEYSDIFLPSAQPATFGQGWTGTIDEIRIMNDYVGYNWHVMVGKSDIDRAIMFGDAFRPPVAAGDLSGRVAEPDLLFTFGAGTVARNEAGDPVAIRSDDSEGHLVILGVEEPDRLEVSDGVLWLKEPNRLQTDMPPTDFTDTCQQANALTVEAWVMPDNNLVGGPARILSLSQDGTYRNFTLGQDSAERGERGHHYRMRIRTSDTESNGYYIEGSGYTPRTTSDDHELGRLEHIMAVYDGAITRIYVDGALVATQPWTGDFTPWDNTHHLLIGNEVGTSLHYRPWMGAISLLAVYCRALTPADVAQNFAAGP